MKKLLPLLLLLPICACKFPFKKRAYPDAGTYTYSSPLPTVTTTATIAPVPTVDPEAVAKRNYATHKASCDAGDAFACVNVGYDYQTGLGVPQDFATSAVYYKKACDTHTRVAAE